MPSRLSELNSIVIGLSQILDGFFYLRCALFDLIIEPFGVKRFMFFKNKKAATTFQPWPLHISTIIYPCFRLSASTRLNELLRLQFLFVFRRIQSLQLLLPTHPCLPLSLPTSLGRPFHGLRRFLSAF